MKKIILDGGHLTIEDVVVAARGYFNEVGDHCFPTISLSGNARSKLRAFRKALEDRIAAGDVIYGVNTGCGIKKGTIIPNKEIDDYQRFYIPAHCVAVGDYFPKEVVRAAMILRVNSFAIGHSGVRLELCEQILTFYEHGIIPCIPQQGSVGSSGDLALLAHLSAALIGIPDQRVWLRTGDKIEEMSVVEAFAKTGVSPIELKAKEAMGLTNGSTFTLALGILAINDVEKLLNYSDLAMALSLEAIRGECAAFDPRIHAVRHHKGEVMVAAKILELVKGSKRVTKESQDVCLTAEENTKKYQDKEKTKPLPRVQDAYSFRAYPQVAGPVYEAFNYAKKVFLMEMNAATDNPLVFKDGDDKFIALSGGNFHGEPLAQAADFLKIAVSQIANISDRRFYAMTMSNTSYGLPADLAGLKNQNLNTGLMILQYTTASLVSENKILCHPSVIDSIPTSANQEDYVSMGTTGARFLKQVVSNTYCVIAAELLAAAQGISLTSAELEKYGCAELGEKTKEIYEEIRKLVPYMEDDRFVHSDVNKIINMMRK